MKRSRLLELFLDEARPHLRQAHDQVQRFEHSPQQTETLRALMRHCHSLKGMAATLSFEPFVAVAHRMESLLRELNRRPRAWSAELAPLFAAGLRQLEQWTDSIAQGEEPRETADARHVMERFDALFGPTAEAQRPTLEPALQPAAATPRWAVRLVLQVSSASPTHRIVSTLKRVSRVGQVVRVRPPQLPVNDSPSAMQLELELQCDRNRATLTHLLQRLAWVTEIEIKRLPDVRPARATDDTPSSWTRVPLASLDWVADSLRQLALDNDLREDHDPAVARAAAVRSEFMIRRIFDRVDEMRLVPAASLSHRLEPAVRDAALHDDKRAKFRLVGGDIGLERSLLDRLVEPLRHLVRNAVAHGIESPTDRAAAGKPAEGLIEIEFTRQHDRLLVEVRDDGRGMCAERIAKAAIEASAVDVTAVESMSTGEQLRLAFLPAVTTRDRPDRVAGRGAGLDVVAAEFASLSAPITIRSEPGQGTTFQIDVPLSQSVVRSLVFRREGQVFGIPLNAVRQARASDHSADTSEIIDLGPQRSTVPETGFLLVLDNPERSVALLADEVLGRRDLWLQPLMRSFATATYVHGAAIIEDGSMALMLDPKRLAAAH